MSKKLTHKEEEIMQILWELEKGFVNDILEKMEEPKPPYNTVSSTVRKLVADELIGYEAFGKTHRYFPILTKEEYRKTAFGTFMENYFAGSPSEVLSFFVNEEKVNPDELNELLVKLKKN
jgi:BlaI family transcriptional regulator, penicillinase repressor